MSFAIAFYRCKVGVLLALALGCVVGEYAVADGIAIVGSGDNSRVEVFYARSGQNSGIYHSYQTTPGINGAFHQWVTIAPNPANTSSIVATRDQSGRLVVGWLNGTSIMVSEASVAGGAMPTPEALTVGTAIYDLSVAINADERVEFFARDISGNIYSVAQTQPDSWSTLNIHKLAPFSFPSALASASFRDGRLALVGSRTFFSVIPGVEGVAWRSQNGPGNNWGDWQELDGPPLTEIAAQSEANGALAIVGIGRDGLLHENKQDANYNWQGWTTIPSGAITFSNTSSFTGHLLSLVKEPSGKLDLFALGSSVFHATESAPNGPWAPGIIEGNLVGYSGSAFSFAALPAGPIVVGTTDPSECLVSSYYQIPQEPNFKFLTSPTPAIPCPPTFKVTALYAKPNPVPSGQPTTIYWNYVANLSCLPLNLALTNGSQTIVSSSATGSFFSEPVTPSASRTTYTFTGTCVGVSNSANVNVKVIAPGASSSPNVVFANGPFYTPTFPPTGTSFTAQIIFANVGNGQSPQYTVSLAVDDNLGDPQIPVDTESIPPLAPNQQVPVNFSVKAQQWDYFGLVFLIQQTGAGQTYEISTF